MAFDFISNFSTFQVLAPHKAPPGGSKPSSMSLVGLRFIHITALSDGNPNHTPTGRDYKKVDPPTLYLERCGDIWAKTYGLDKRYSHYLQTLPRGYTFWQKPRLGNPKHIDGWLYGHPRRKRFTSPNEFFTHLQYLVENQGISMGCPCRQCNGPTGTLGPLRPGPRSVSSTASISTPSVQQVTVSPAATPALESTTSSPAPTLARKPGRPPKDASATANTYKSSTNTPGLFKDEEGTPDVIQGLLKKLEKEGQLDQAIEEKLSPDFEAIRLPLKEWQEQTAAQPGWAPRAGEVVLFVRTMAPDCAISYEKHTRSFKIYDHTEKKFLGHPNWEAGVISQETVGPFRLAIEDVLNKTIKKQNITYYGYRVEPMPAPNQSNKALSLRYVYVPIHNIRPFAFWKEVLQGVDRIHETITNAQTIMSTAALVGRHRFKGTWPNASIFCSGIYIGSEFIQPGDLIRLAASTGPPTVTANIMEVRHIKLSFANVQPSSTAIDPESSGMFVAGKAFTTDPTGAISDTDGPLRAQNHPEYGILYWLHDLNRLYQVSLAKVLGRCFEPDAVRLWFPTLADDSPATSLSLGLQGVFEARDYSTKIDNRIKPGQSWYWAETRMQALDLQSLNGIEASSHDRLREDKLEAGQKALRMLARPTAQNQADMRQAAKRPKAQAGDALGMGKQNIPTTTDVGRDTASQGDDQDGREYTSDQDGHDDERRKASDVQPSVDRGSSDDEVEIIKIVAGPSRAKKRRAEAMAEASSSSASQAKASAGGSTSDSVKEEDEDDPVKMLQRFKAQKTST